MTSAKIRLYRRYIETQKKLNDDRFNEHCRPVDEPTHISKPTMVSEDFLTDYQTDNDISLIPLELIRSNRHSVSKAREAHLITRGNTLQP